MVFDRRHDSSEQSETLEPAMNSQRSILGRLFGLAWAFRAHCVAALLWALGAQAIMLVVYIFSGLAIDIIRDDGAVDWPFGIALPVEWTLTTKVSMVAASALALTLVQSVVYYQSRIADERLVQKVIVSLRTRLYEHLQRMNFAYFDGQDSGTLINRITGDAASVRLFLQSVLVRVGGTVTALLLYLAYMSWQQPLLTLAVISVIPLQVFALRRYTTQIRPQFSTMRKSMDRLVQSLQESILGVRVVRGFGQESQVVKKLDEANADARQKRMGIVHTASKHMPMVPAVNFIQLAILLAFGGYLVHLGPEEGGIRLGTLWVFLALIRQMSAQVDRLVQSASTIPEAMTGAQRVFELLDAPIEIDSPDSDAISPNAVRGMIKFEDVCFRYPSSGSNDALILNEINLTIQPGEMIAIVGPAGSGKTTLLHMIGRFYEPVSGRVFVDGHDVREWDLPTLRRSIGFAMQEPFLFSNTIEKNISFGNIEASFDRVQEAANITSALSFIEESSHGFDTVVGERGLTLSGGERQRINLARTILSQPAILLLDDAMSAVDARTEVSIQGALDEVMQHRTTIVIAHRLSTVRRANRIVVLEHGRIQAVGTHAELMESNAHYRKAAQIQLDHDVVSDDDDRVADSRESEVSA